MFARSRDARGPAWARDTRSLPGVIASSLLLGGVIVLAARMVGPSWGSTATAPSTPSGSASVASKPTAPSTPSGSASVASKPTAPASASGGASGPNSSTSVTPSEPAKPVATASPKASSGASKPGVAQAAPKAAVGKPAHPAAASGSTAGAASRTTHTRPAVGTNASSPAHLDEQVTYHYNALGRRDPFQSLLSGEYVGSDVGGDAPPDVGGIKVVGIVWGDADQFALVEDARGDSHILRRGDKVMNGYVEGLKRDAMIVNLTLDGQSQSVTVPLTRKGEKTNANR